MAYVDGFVIPVPKDKLDAYKALAKLCAQVWKEHGALASWNVSETTCPTAR